MVVSGFLFLVTKSLKSRRLDLLSNHDICFPNFSFSSRNWRKSQISRFFCAKILVLFLNQKTDLNISLFSSRNSRYGFHISLSLLDFTFWHLVNACITTLFISTNYRSTKCLQDKSEIDSVERKCKIHSRHPKKSPEDEIACKLVEEAAQCLKIGVRR